MRSDGLRDSHAVVAQAITHDHRVVVGHETGDRLPAPAHEPHAFVHWRKREVIPVGDGERHRQRRIGGHQAAGQTPAPQTAPLHRRDTRHGRRSVGNHEHPRTPRGGVPAAPLRRRLHQLHHSADACGPGKPPVDRLPGPLHGPLIEQAVDAIHQPVDVEVGNDGRFRGQEHLVGADRAGEMDDRQTVGRRLEGHQRTGVLAGRHEKHVGGFEIAAGVWLLAQEADAVGAVHLKLLDVMVRPAAARLVLGADPHEMGQRLRGAAAPLPVAQDPGGDLHEDVGALAQFGAADTEDDLGGRRNPELAPHLLPRAVPFVRGPRRIHTVGNGVHLLEIELIAITDLASQGLRGEHDGGRGTCHRPNRRPAAEELLDHRRLLMDPRDDGNTAGPAGDRHVGGCDRVADHDAAGAGAGQLARQRVVVGCRGGQCHGRCGGPELRFQRAPRQQHHPSGAARLRAGVPHQSQQRLGSPASRRLVGDGDDVQQMWIGGQPVHRQRPPPPARRGGFPAGSTAAQHHLHPPHAPGQPRQPSQRIGNLSTELHGASLCSDVWPRSRSSGISSGARPPSRDHPSVCHTARWTQSSVSADLKSDGMPLIAGTVLDYRSTRSVSAIRTDRTGWFATRRWRQGLSA